MVAALWTVLAAMLANQSGAPHPARLTAMAVRSFVQEEERAWNARDAQRFFNLHSPDAVFIDRRREPNGTMRQERRTADQAKSEAMKFFAKAKFSETAFTDTVTIAPDGQSAQASGYEIAKVTIKGVTRLMRATTNQRIELRAGRMISLGQTDTLRTSVVVASSAP